MSTQIGYVFEVVHLTVCIHDFYMCMCFLKDMRTIKFAHKQEGHSRRGAYERLQVSSIYM